jgi:hypothetical protein
VKYVPPYGITDPNASYINGDPSIGRQGSIPPAAAFENPMRELVSVISNSNITPDDTDLTQLAKGVRSQWMNYVEDSGATNAILGSLAPALQTYTVGLPIRVKVLHTNTTAGVTADFGAGPRNVKKMSGADPGVGALPSGGIVELTYDGTQWQLTNFGGADAGGGGNAEIYTVNIPYVVDTSATANHIIAPFSPALTGLIPGTVLLVKIAHTVTGPTDIVVNALASKPIVASDGLPLLPGDFVTGDILYLKYDGTNFFAETDIAITTDVTFNIPSTQFPDFVTVMNSLKRKTIASNATVTILFAAGVFPPFKIYHANGDRIVVKGTMLAAPPTSASFVATGNSQAARNADAQSNIAMLRSRYGTEIRTPISTYMNNFYPNYAIGIMQGGPGTPMLKDILVTGDGVGPSTNGNMVLVAAFGHSLNCNNVAVWGSGGPGFYAKQGGMMDFIVECSADYCTEGFLASLDGVMRMTKGVFGFGNHISGVEACWGANIYMNPTMAGGTGSFLNFNGQEGIVAHHNGSICAYNATALGNGNVDVLAIAVASVDASGSNCGSFSPALNTGGNIYSYIGAGAIPVTGPF